MSVLMRLLWPLILSLLPILVGKVYAQAPLEVESNTASPPPINFVLMINDSDTQFWQLSQNAALAAAKDLGIELQIINLKNNPLRPIRVLSTLLSSNQMPDAVIFSNLKNTGDDILKQLEQHKIKSFVFDNGFAPEQKVGNPGEQFRFWQGQLLSHNQDASKALTHQLIDTALQRLSPPLHIIALEGAPSAYVNRERLLGFYDAINDYGKQVTLDQVFTTHWQRKDARNAVLAAKQRYPDARLFWAANDEVAMSAADTLIELGEKPGETVFIVGFDRLPLIEKRLRKGHILDSYGGQYMSAAWAVIYMFDHLNGYNNAPRSMRLPLSSAYATSTMPFDAQIRAGHFNEIDFKVFSKKYGLSDQDYPFLLP